MQTFNQLFFKKKQIFSYFFKEISEIFRYFLKKNSEIIVIIQIIFFLLALMQPFFGCRQDLERNPK